MSRARLHALRYGTGGKSRERHRDVGYIKAKDLDEFAKYLKQKEKKTKLKPLK